MSAAAKLKIRVIPNAKKTEFSGSRGDEIVLRLNAPAVDGKANQAAVDFLSSVVWRENFNRQIRRKRVISLVGLDRLTNF